MGRIHSVSFGPGRTSIGMYCFTGLCVSAYIVTIPIHWCVTSGQEIGLWMARDILRYKNFIKNGGVTLSGGEPLIQPDFVVSILEGCIEHKLHTAIDTAGGVSLLMRSGG